jgi:hypothetical protein
MGTNDVLRRSIQQTHDGLAERLQAARAMSAPPEEPRQCHERIDVFLATASKHLHAVDAVLLAPARRQVPDGGQLVHDYLRSARDLEVVLAHVKAHEYGSVYETGYAWPGVWCDVRTSMFEHRRHEQVLAVRLRNAEFAAPTRPHPYTPHTGLLGLVSRRVMHTADSFWDSVEGRMVPEPRRAPKKEPGRFTQYLLGDPRFDEEGQPRS